MFRRSVAIFLVSLGLLIGAYYYGNEILDVLLMANTSEDKNTDEIGEKVKPLVEDQLFFLLIGVDEDEDGSSTNTRTDTMMLTKVDFNDGTIDMLSIPRDTKVQFDGGTHKINAANVYGGPLKSLKEVGRLLDVKVDYFVMVDFSGFEKFVDAIGGIEVDSPAEINLPTVGVHIPEGVSHLDGKHALHFARLRSYMGWGDLERIENQQSIVKIILDQTLKPSNITKIPEFFKIYRSDVRTNIPFSTAARCLPKITNFSSDRLNTHTLPGYGDTEYYGNGTKASYYYVDEEETCELIDEIFSEYKINSQYEMN